MLYLIPILLFATALLIWILHRNQQKSAQEIAELSAPLPGVEESCLYELSHDSPPSTAPEAKGHWQTELKALKEQGSLEAALALCQDHYPRAQAFQQAAVILRQQIRQAVDSQLAANAALEGLYRVAVMADLFRSDNLIRPTDGDATLQMLEPHALPYLEIGYRQLKLLNKSDIKHLQQLWGNPAHHRHGEEALGEIWALACMAKTGRMQ